MLEGAPGATHERPGRLLGAERRDLLQLLRGELARSLATGHLLTLDVLADVLDDLGVRQRGRVSDIGEVRDRGDDPAHDLSGARLRHVRNDPDVRRARDLPDMALDRLAHLLLDLAARAEAGLERHVHLDGPAANVVDHRDGCGLGDLLDGDACRLELFGAEPVPGDVDHVVDPAEDPEVAVGRLHGPVARHVRPVAPVLAILVRAVLLVVGLDEPLGRAPDRLEAPGPGVADADVARPAASRLEHVAVLGIYPAIYDEDARPAAARLHRLQCGQGAAQETAVLGLPPGVDDGCLALADTFAVPAPDLRLDRLTDGRHVLEAVVVLCRLVRPELAQHPDRRGRGVEDVHPEPLRDPPGTTGIRIRGHALVDDARRPERQRTVDDVGVAGDPADVGEAPVRVLRVDVLVVRR